MPGFAFINSKKLIDLIKIIQNVLADYSTHPIRGLGIHLGGGVGTEKYV
ncbi:MAG: hypothetical protein L0H53_12290 [Candidatus Nitrosocosmicus sp.]|nr:hypothetical protein [Candidatus Nitrosocosmicus sp.]MDN5866131.1 hypothetical protein [Candidatus Nitrosocosmicus sp.]